MLSHPTCCWIWMAMWSCVTLALVDDLSTPWPSLGMLVVLDTWLWVHLVLSSVSTLTFPPLLSSLQPERINLQPSEKGYDVRADIWSLGITLVELANGCSPYAEQKFSNEFQLLTYIVKAPPPLPDRNTVSPLFYDFVSKWYVVHYLWRHLMCILSIFLVQPC